MSQFNGASLKDSDVVKDIKIPLEGIGWYELEVLNEAEASDYRGQRAAGNPYAGYDRAITNEEIKRTRIFTGLIALSAKIESTTYLKRKIRVHKKGFNYEL